MMLKNGSNSQRIHVNLCSNILTVRPTRIETSMLIRSMGPVSELDMVCFLNTAIVYSSYITLPLIYSDFFRASGAREFHVIISVFFFFFEKWSTLFEILNSAKL